VVFDQLPFHFFVGKSPVTADEVKEAADGFFGFCDGGGEEFVVVADVFEKFPVDDEAFAVFSDEQGVAEFDFGSAFPTYDYVRTWFVVAEDFVFGGEAASADDAFVGLLFENGEEGEGLVDPVNDELGLGGAEVGAAFAEVFQKVAVFAGVTGNTVGEVFEQAEDFFALFFTINSSAGIA